MKKLMSIVLAAVLLLGLAVPAMAADEEFVIKSTVLVEYNGDGGNIVIPDGVTEIGSNIFNKTMTTDNTTITGVYIPNSVKKIGFSAFAACVALEEVNIPDSVTSIDGSAFRRCEKLRKINIPSSVTELGGFVFVSCYNLTDISIDADITCIGSWLFAGCSSLSSIDIPSSVTSIEECAFYNCSSLKNITISSGVTSIGHDAFASSGLTSIDIPSSVTKIGTSVFSGCSNLRSVKLSDSITIVDTGSFKDCTGLTDFTFPASIKIISAEAFWGCTNLKSITIPADIEYIGNSAFLDCDSLTDVYFGGTQEQWEKLRLNDPINGINPLLRCNIHYSEKTPEQPTPTTISFTDVPASAYYADAVKWAIDKGITNGTGANTFSPDTTCNTAQILTFLWRACGSPKANAANSFTDVAGNAYYYDAAQWAKAQGMVSGSTLSPDAPCTRASTVMFIWQAAGRPGAGSAATFTDVPANADYAAAVAWAVENGVTTGTGADTFSPDATCTRGQIVTFLYRAAAVK